MLTEAICRRVVSVRDAEVASDVRIARQAGMLLLHYCSRLHCAFATMLCGRLLWTRESVGEHGRLQNKSFGWYA
jgi:hypothetical protein